MCFENSKDKVIIEYGCQWSKDIEDNAVKSGFTYQGKVICYYGTGNNMRPCDIHFMTKSSTISFTDEFIDLCKEKRDLNLVSYIFDYVSVQEGDICFDPMCGMGFTAQAAMKNRMQFRGNELNKARLNKTIKKLERGV
jgi:DNA modification methylase